MATASDIQEISEKIRREFAPHKIILFGSYAWGNPGNDSDVDLLVVMPYQGKSWKKAVDIRERINTCFALDLLVRTPDQLQMRLSQHDSFMTEIVTRGKVLYEV